MLFLNSELKIVLRNWCLRFIVLIGFRELKAKKKGNSWWNLSVLGFYSHDSNETLLWPSGKYCQGWRFADYWTRVLSLIICRYANWRVLCSNTYMILDPVLLNFWFFSKNKIVVLKSLLKFIINFLTNGNVK